MKRDGWKFYMAIVAFVASALWLVVPVHAATFEDCIAATCRVRADDGSTGSGCLYDVGPIETGGEEYGWVLTAAHVAVGRDLDCQFGRAEQKVRVRVYWRRGSVDAGVLVAPWSAFPTPKPRPIRVAPPSVHIKVGQSIFSLGCPGGGPLMLWTGTVKNYSGGAMWFWPGPELGRSGSPIFAYLDGDPAIVGVISARDSKNLGPNTVGRAITPAMLYSETPTATAAVWHPVQCENGQCVDPRLFNERYQFSPYRQKEQDRNNYLYRQIQEKSQGTSPLPQPVQPQTPPLDMKPLEQRVTTLEFDAGQAAAERAELKRRADLVRDTAEKLAEKYEQQLPGISTDVKAAIQASSDAVRAASTATETADKAKGDAADATTKAEETEKTVGEALDEDNPKGPLGRIKARVEERVEGLKEKLSGLNVLGFSGMGLGAAGIVLGIIALLVRRDVKDRKETGDPLLVEKLLKRLEGVAANTSNTADDKAIAIAEAVATRIADRIAPRPTSTPTSQ